MKVIIIYLGKVVLERLVLEDTKFDGRVARFAMVGLTYGEHLIVWGLRRVVTESGPDGLLLDECCCAFSDDGDEALRMLCLFLCMLGRSARRPFEIGAPGALAVTRDENRILMLLAAAQRWAENGDQALVDAHLLWLAAPEHRPALAQVTLALGNLLAAHGYVLAIPVAAVPQPAEAWPGKAVSRALH